jgi:hypothetical protein
MAGKNLPTTGIIPTTPEAERGLRVDLTPLDMYFAGFIVRRHLYLGYWCWWHGHPSGGAEYSAPYETLDEVYADARWRLTGKQYVEKAQPQLLVEA